MVRPREKLANSTVHALARLANELALLCPRSDSAFSVGAVIASPDGDILGTGFSRQTGVHDHAEEVALAAVRAAGHDPAGMHAYVSLEPCGQRASKPTSCAQLLIEARLARVYYTTREPPVFVEQNGVRALENGDVECIQLTGFGELFERANAHLLDRLAKSRGD